MLYFAISLVLGICVADLVLERPETHNWNWKKVGRSDRSNGIDLIFALKQQNVGLLHDTLMSVSSPSSPQYGQHLTMKEVQEMVKPTESTISSVKEWLLSNGASTSAMSFPTPDFLKLSTTIGFAEDLLSTDYYDYFSHETYPNSIVSRVDHEMDYFVPNALVAHLDFIAPTKRFPSPMRINASNLNYDWSPSPDAAVTPSFLRSLYSVGDTVGSNSTSLLGVASFLDQYYSKNDLDAFWKRYSIPTSNVSNVPSDTPSGHGIEAELDTQYITAMGEKIAMQVWYTKGRAPNNNANEPFLSWLMSVENSTNAPLLFSISYGEDEKSVGLDYGSRVNTEFAKCGATGMSFLFASGDSGAGGNCTHSGGRECPNFPTGSPYVTSVGGTESKPEVAWSGSGGGFSDYWAQQSWQSDAIETYIATAGSSLPAQNKWNVSGRGYPDLSAQSVDFTIVVAGVPMGVSGTSCATPTASGVFALLNDLRLNAGMPPMGFLNPFLYETAAKDATVLNDITSGRNTGCGGAAFPAVKGWDAVTGYGTPNYANLAKYALETGKKAKMNKKQKINLAHPIW